VNQLADLAKRPFTVVDLLGEAIPLQANFFVAFVMTNAILKSAARLIKWMPLCCTHCKLALCAKSKRKRDMLKRVPPGFDWAGAIATHTFIFLLVMTYCTITPIIVPFGLLYFAFMYFIDKYQLLFVGQPKTNLVGMMYPVAFNQLCFALCIYNLVMFGYFLGAGFIPGIVISILCAIFCILYSAYMNYKYVLTRTILIFRWEDIGFYGSLDGILELSTIDKKKFRYEYVHPILMPIPPEKREYETHEQLLWKQRGYTLSDVSHKGVFNHTWSTKKGKTKPKADKGKGVEDPHSNEGDLSIEMHERKMSSSSSSSS
jgi:hypothetical protein